MTDLQDSVGPEDHIRGPELAPLTLVEYGDFECPYSRLAYRSIESLLAARDDLRFVFRHFPLTEIHPHALPAAEAAEAAAAQGHYWPMHDLLFHRQKALEDDHLRGYARELGLEAADFDAALAVHTGMERIRANVESGERSGVRGTPTLFVNGVRHEGDYDEGSLAAALKATRTDGR